MKGHFTDDSFESAYYSIIEISKKNCIAYKLIKISDGSAEWTFLINNFEVSPKNSKCFKQSPHINCFSKKNKKKISGIYF